MNHREKLEAIGFIASTMKRTDRTLQFLRSYLQDYYDSVQQDLDDLAEDLRPGEWSELTMAADQSLVEVLVEHLSARQKEALLSILSEEVSCFTE